MSKQVVFIDSRVPDLQDLLKGLNSDEQAFVINGHSDGLDQIVALLEANHLTDLSAISIVGHGASGEIDLGSTVIDDANLAGEAAALSVIGAAIATGGNLALFACDTAAGPAGQKFISDLSAFAGGVDVAAATHLVGNATLGASWTLDASTSAVAAPANVPFTNQALASFHGTLGTLSVTAGATTIYHGGDAAQPLDPGLTVTDVSNATLVGASVQIVNFASGDTLNFTDQNNIHGSYNVNTGLLALSGNDTAADYQAALRSITYSFAGNGDPSAGGHQGTYISWRVSDGNAADVAPAPINNDQPTLGLNQLVVLNGTFPAVGSDNGTSDGGGIPLAAIRTFAGSTVWGGTAAADGQVLSLQQNTALFSVLGTNYGGNGTTDFGIPNLQAHIAVGFEQNPSSGAFLGQTIGSDTVTLTQQNLPANRGGSGQPVNNDQPSLTLNYIINTAGAIPGAGGSSVDVVGEVVPFLGQFAPAGYLFANGQLLASSHYSNLYDALGTTYGGDGTTFALPNLTGKTIIGAGTSLLSGTQVTIGTTSGQDNTAIVAPNLPFPQGGGAPISNQQPSLALTYLIDPFGLFPSSSGTPVANTADIGEIIAFAGTGAALNDMLAAGWMVANGATLGISQYQTLFSVIGTTYGGNGTTDFVLPDLVGHSVAGVGSSNGVSVTLGQNYGTANIALAPNQVPLTTSTLDIAHTAPTVTAGATTPFAVGGTAVPLDDALTVTDPDSGGNLTGATIKIGSGFVAGDTLHFVNQNGISGSYVAGTGILTLNGNDTLAHYQTALDSITFGTTDTNAGARTIDWSVTDGSASNGTSATANSTVNVVIPAKVTSVAATTTANATDLDANKVVTITVNFDHAVNVTGSPELQLNDSEVATYASGTGTAALTFSYTVQPNDTAADLQVQSLLLNGGTIRDGAGIEAVTTSAATDLHLQVDTTAPTVSSIVAGGFNPNYGGSEQFTVNFSESVTGVDASDFTVATRGTADTGFTVTPVSGSVYTVTVDGVSGTGTLGLNLNASGTGINDLAGNAISGGFTGGNYAIDPALPPPLDSVMTHPTLTVTLDRVGVDPDNTVYAAQTVVGLLGGGSAVDWLDPTGQSHTGQIEFLSATGDVTATISLSGTPFAQLSSGNSQLTPLSNGDVALTYSGQDGNTYFSVVGQSGVVVDPTLVTSASTAGHATQLSNGDIAVPSEVVVSSTPTLQINFYSTQAATIGNSVGTTVQISNAQLLSAPNSNNMVANDSGSFAVIYNSLSDNQVHAGFYANGSASPTSTIALGAASLAQVVALSGGDFAVLASDASYANFSLQIYTPNGGTVGNAVSLPGINGDIFLAADLTPGQQGFTVFNDHNDDGNVYAIRFDNAGNIVAGGTQNSQGNIASIENSGSGVEVYHGNGQYFLAGAAGGHSAGEVNLFLNQSNSAPVLQTYELAPPTVTSVAVPANGTYGTGQHLVFTVNYNENVFVATGGGTPYLSVTLDTGGTVHAAYTGGSGTPALTFDYVVASGNDDANGVAVGSAITLNGGTITDAATIAAGLTLNGIASATGVLVDTIPPTVSSIHIVEGSTNNLHSEDFTVTFSAGVHGVDVTDFTLAPAGTVAGSIALVTAVNANTYTVTVNNVTGDGTLRLDLNNTGDAITDNLGNTLTSAHTGEQSYTIDHIAPGAPTVALAHDTGVSNTDGITSNPTITVTPAESGGSLLYKIDGATSFSATAPNFATNGSADGTHTVTVEQQDAAGNIGAPTTLSFTLDTIAPAAPTQAVSLAHDTGISGTDHITNDPTIAYAAPASGDYFLFTVDNGSFSTTVPPTFATDHSADGLHTISVEEVDSAGNISTPANFHFTLDTIAPQIAVVTASPSNGIEGVGQTVAIDLAFGEAVAVTGGTPTLSLNDNGIATYDAAATAALHDPTKLVFDYTVAVSDAITSPLAVTGINLHGAVIEDFAGNAANLSNVATTFTGLGIDSSLITANPDSNQVLAGQTVTADAAHGVLANDTDSNPNDHVVISAVDGLSAGVNQPVAGAYGSLTMHADGSYSYSAGSSASGVAFDTFTYAASNGHGPPSTSTLTVEVVGANQNVVQVPSGGSATGGFGNTVIDGSAGNSTLTAATTFNAHQILIGGPGDVLNAASFGQDTFVFANNFGHETINNFHPALDVIQLQQSQFGSLAAVMADIQQVGANSVLTLDANHVITIANTPHASLTAADFHLA